MGRVARTKAVIYSPPTETELRLQELQEKFLDPNGCSKADKDEFFLVMRMYARSITLQMIKSKGLVLPPERVDEVCTDATLAILKQYQKVGWKIEASFAGALRWKVIESVYGPKNEESHYSLNTTFSDDTDSKEMLDLVSSSSLPWSNDSYCDDPEETTFNQYSAVVEEVNRLLDEAYEILDYRLYVRFLPWLLLNIRKTRARNVMQTFTSCFLTSREESAFELLLLELRNRLSIIA